MALFGGGGSTFTSGAGAFSFGDGTNTSTLTVTSSSTTLAAGGGTNADIILTPKGSSGKVTFGGATTMRAAGGQLEVAFNATPYLALNSGGIVTWTSTSNSTGGTQDTGLARTSPGVVKVTNGSSGSGAINILGVAGAVSDGSFTSAPPDNTMAFDSTNKKIYIRFGGTWYSTAALT